MQSSTITRQKSWNLNPDVIPHLSLTGPHTIKDNQEKKETAIALSCSDGSVCSLSPSPRPPRLTYTMEPAHLDVTSVRWTLTLSVLCQNGTGDSNQSSCLQWGLHLSTWFPPHRPIPIPSCRHSCIVNSHHKSQVISLILVPSWFPGSVKSSLKRFALLFPLLIPWNWVTL